MDWIDEAAKELVNKQVAKAREKYMREEEANRQREHVEFVQANRIAAGNKLWADFRGSLKYDAKAFNKSYADAVQSRYGHNTEKQADVIHVEERADGATRTPKVELVKVKFSDDGVPERVAEIAYDPEKATLSWKVFGDAEGVPIQVGVKRGDQDFHFMIGESYAEEEEIAKQVVLALLP